MGLKIEDLCVDLQKNQILRNINLNIESGEFICLLGPSGCGKSTLLKSIAGLQEVRAGQVSIDGNNILPLPPEKRGTVIVFQDLCLFPHMTVEQNVAFSMQLQRVPKHKQKQKVKELLEIVQLPGFEKRRIREMSGGQKQRVALARALAANPKVLLLDEPFSSLDENLREEMGYLVKKLHQQMGCTTIMVTHDRREAMRYSDKIALMMDGEILQYGEPRKLFYQPISKAVVDYVGQGTYLVGTVKEGQFTANGWRCPVDAEDGAYEMLIRSSASNGFTEGEDAYSVAEIFFRKGAKDA